MDKGVRQLAKAVLRKQNIATTDQNYTDELKSKEELVRLHIFGGKRGPKVAVHEQIERLKDLSKKFGLTVNYQKFFNEITADKELINCLIDIGREEVMCSKRLMFVATERER